MNDTGIWRAARGRLRPEMTRLALALVCLCIGSCVSVPLSTMVRMSAFDERDFAALDPEVLRVGVKLPEGFGLDSARSRLGVEVRSAAGVHEGSFELDQVLVQATQIPGGIFSSAEPGTAYTLRLSAPSKAKFRELQAFVGKARADEIAIRVVPRLSSFPKDAVVVTVWIDLLLSTAQGYFTLLEAAEIPLEKIRQNSTES